MPKRSPLLLFVVALAALSGVSQGQASQKKIYFLPIGKISAATVQRLVSHYRKKFDIAIPVLPRIQPSAIDYDLRRDQYRAESLIAGMQQAYPKLAKDPNAILIGITDKDIYPLSENWQFCFGWRKADAHIAVASTARMNLHYPGEPRSGTDVQTRLQKVITKDIGIMYFGMSPNNNPRSVLYSQILGIQELDEVSEDF